MQIHTEAPLCRSGLLPVADQASRVAGVDGHQTGRGNWEQRLWRQGWPTVSRQRSWWV